MLSKRQKTLLRLWLGLSRTRFFTAVITPCIIGVAVAFTDGFFPLINFILLIIGLIMAEMMNLFLADWVEYKGIDISQGRAMPPPHLEGSPVLSSKILPLQHTIFAAGMVALPALAVLVFFAVNLGWLLWVILFIAGLAGGFYVAPPFAYAFFSTAFMPPVIAFGAYFALSGMAGWKAGLSALPLVFLSCGVIYTYRILYEPRVPGRFEIKRKYLKMSYAACYLTMIIVAILGCAPLEILLGLLSLPLYFFIDKVTSIEKSDFIPATSLGVFLHFITGILISIGYLISGVTWKL
jgi:1,4-dihydroxy-2-naphthoate octaprenyltransferase